MLHLADALDIPDKFWVVGYSGGGMHAWSALRYIPDRVAGTYLR
jgi:pimeloyl-ACP methyl ester carboxylesterase